MGDLDLRLSRTEADASAVSPPPIGRLLIDSGKIGQNDLMHALKLQTRIDAPIGDIMVSEGLIEKRDVLAALAAQARTEGADLELAPPAPHMAERLPADLCLRYGVVPQVIPPFLSFTIYRWDINVRMSTIIGLVGGGGIGFLLVQYIRLLDYRAAGIAEQRMKAPPRLRSSISPSTRSFSTTFTKGNLTLVLG